MFRSIHSKLIAWLTIVLVLVVGGFGTSLYLLVHGATLGEVDAELAMTAQIIADRLRSQRPPPPPGGRKKGGMPKPKGPGDPFHPHSHGPKERRLEEVVDRFEVPDSIQRRSESGEGGAHYFAIWSLEGTLLRMSSPDLGVPAVELPREEGSFEVRRRGDLREYFLRGPRGALVVAGTSIRRELADERRLVGFLLGAGSAVMAIGLAGAWFISKRAMLPIREISATVEEISASNLDRRIDLAATETELGGLARVLNSAFDRLQDSIEKQVQFTADASHELRTPVSVILAQTSMARRRERAAEEYREVIETCHSAAGRMKSLVEGLLMLARNDSGELQPRMGECDLRQLAEECIDLLAPLASEREISIHRNLGEASVEADAELLVQAVSNIVSNAIRHNRKGGEARISLRVEGTEAVLSVSDNGPGIPAEDLTRIFDRFYRVDASRSRRDGGTGLGLSIARAVAAAHGGSLSCESRPGEGATFTLRLHVRQPGHGSSPPPETPSDEALRGESGTGTGP